jgi:hypothetical protein
MISYEISRWAFDGGEWKPEFSRARLPSDEMTDEPEEHLIEIDV